jgi:hypothetical protein
MNENNNIIDYENTLIETPKKVQIGDIRAFGYDQEHIDIIKKGFIPKTTEDKWYIYSKDNWIYFHRAWTGQRIYEVELKYINGSYIVDDFIVERNIEKYNNTDDEYDLSILHVLIDYGLLGYSECLGWLLEVYNKNESDAIKLWDVLGSFWISLEDIARYNLIKNTKIPCKEVFKTFNEKMEMFIGILENLQYHKIIPINEFQEFVANFVDVAAKMGEMSAKLVLLINNEPDINKILENINKNFKFIYTKIDSVEKEICHKYFKNDKRSFTLEKLISDLISNSKSVKITEKAVKNFFSYKEIISNEIFSDCYMLRLDY